MLLALLWQYEERCQHRQLTETARVAAAHINDSLKLLWYHSSSSSCCNLLLALGGIELVGFLVWVFFSRPRTEISSFVSKIFMYFVHIIVYKVAQIMKTIFEESFSFSVFVMHRSSVFWDMKSSGGEASL